MRLSPNYAGTPPRPTLDAMARRVILLYAILGPVAGAFLYVLMSALAAALGIGSGVFIEARQIGATLIDNLGLLWWQLAISAPFTALPAMATGWLSARQMEAEGHCPWWLSCLYGGLSSGILAIVGLGLGHLTMPQLTIIPPVAGGSALIALIGFLGTWPCWRLAFGPAPAFYRSSPQNR
jgi:hypothetical protein